VMQVLRKKGGISTSINRGPSIFSHHPLMRLRSPLAIVGSADTASYEALSQAQSRTCNVI